MWIVFGHKVTTERVPNGRSVERDCGQCHERTMFYERRSTESIQLYFLNVLKYGERTVMACGACGALYGTDEMGTTRDSALDGITKATQRAGEAALGAARGVFDKARALAREQLGETHDAQPQPPPSADYDDPLKEEDDALEARFRELEKKGGKVRIGD